MEYALETTFLRRPVRKLIIDDEFWYVVSDVFRAIGSDAIKREAPRWKHKWPKSCRRFEITDSNNKEKTVNVLCARAEELLECFGAERTNRMTKMFLWLKKEWMADMNWALGMDNMRTIAACEEEENGNAGK